MAGVEATRRHTWLWALAAAMPSAVQAGDAKPAATQPVDPGFLEFLAEEPALDEELGDALMTTDLDRAIERSASSRKVKDDDADPK